MENDSRPTETLSQKRPDRQRRRAERRIKREETANPGEIPSLPRKRKSLPGYMAKYRREISLWLRHYMTLICKADDAGLSCVKDMSRDERNRMIQEYIDVSEFKNGLDGYLKEEDEKNRPAS